MSTTEETLALVRGLADIASTYKLAKVSVGDVVIIRAPDQYAAPDLPRAAPPDDDEMLFDAVGGPPQ